MGINTSVVGGIDLDELKLNMSEVLECIDYKTPMPIHKDILEGLYHDDPFIVYKAIVAGQIIIHEHIQLNKCH